MPEHAYRPSMRHADLGTDFFDPVRAAAFPQHLIRFRNQRWAQRTGLDGLSDEEWIAHFGRFEPLPGSFPEPLALRYHGHQFRVYNPDIGDGRGFLFAQVHDLQDGRLLDLATKGSGRTPYSRTADGRLTLKGGVREVLATEMLEALGVYTSKSFSLIETGEQLVRGDEPSPTRSSVLVRLSHSHVRIGTFQRYAALGETANVSRLLDFAVATYFPHIEEADEAKRAVAFLSEVSQRVARLGAEWMAAGFVHGVLNTDNINVTGESFDYGPWRFLPVYDPTFTAAYFDEQGLYAFGRQPNALLWNIARLAECLIPLAPQAELERAVALFEPTLFGEFINVTLRRLGLKSVQEDRDSMLATRVWGFLMESRAPFEQAFFDLYAGAPTERLEASPNAAFYRQPAFAKVREAIDEAQIADDAHPDHPYFARREPVSMLIEEVEAIWAPIAERDDWSAFERKIVDIREMGAAYGFKPER